MSCLTAAVNRASKSELSAKRCSLSNGYDLSTNDGIKVFREIDELKPEHVWLSPICGPYSIMQQVNQQHPQKCEELDRKRRHALKQYVGCALIYTYCVQQGIHATWEWSQSCTAWRLPLMQKLVQRFQPFFAVVRGCQVGLKDRQNNVISKGWKLMTTDKLLAQRVELPCKCPKDRVHVKCEGSLTSKTAFYPPGFAERVTRALGQGCEREGLQNEFRGVSSLPDSFGNGLVCACEEGTKHEAQLTCGMCVHQAQQIIQGQPKRESESTVAVGTPQVLGVHAPDDATSNPPLEGPTHERTIIQQGFGTQGIPPRSCDMSPEEIQKKLHLLHAATGHGPVRHMIQALRRRGVGDMVLRAAGKFECSVCRERQRPKARPLSTFEPLAPKWSTVTGDMGMWEHPRTGQSSQFLLLIDEGSRFRVGRVLGEGKKYHVGAAQFLESFQECWSQYFGLPDTLRLDPDGTFRSKQSCRRVLRSSPGAPRCGAR